MADKTYLDRIILISGGQTGIDRAVLDFCLEHDIRCGGWCPKGRRAEDGIIDLKYPLKEMPGGSYEKRTLANVKESDATVIIFHHEMSGGTEKSLEFVLMEKRPYLLLDLSLIDTNQAAHKLTSFLKNIGTGTINFSGPRHSEWQDGYGLCYAILRNTFE